MRHPRRSEEKAIAPGEDSVLIVKAMGRGARRK
jgi:hypothetical protein